MLHKLKEMVIEILLGPKGKAPLLLRDDDTNFFTTTNMLDCVYSNAWKKRFKVSLSVIPFQKSIDDILVPPSERKTGRSYSIIDNNQLIAFIKKKLSNESIEILQHGFSHTIINRKGEFADSSNLKFKIEHGKEILNQAFGVIPKFFVPPYEDITNDVIGILKEEKMIPIYRQTFVDKFLRSKYIPEFIKRPAFNYLIGKYKNSTNISKFGLLKPVNIHVDTMEIKWSIPILEFIKQTSFESVTDLALRMIRICNKLRSPICIINHYHIYFYDWNPFLTNKNLYKVWNILLNIFSKVNFIWKTSFFELYERIKKIKKMNIIQTESKTIIESKEYINDFAFRTNKRLRCSSIIDIKEETDIVIVNEIFPYQKIILYHL
jgi:hypothetical protein